MYEIKKLVQQFDSEEVIKSFMGASYCRDMLWPNSEYVTSKLEAIIACTAKENKNTIYFKYDDFNDIKKVVDRYYNQEIEKFLIRANIWGCGNTEQKIQELIKSIVIAKFIFYRKEGYTVLVLDFGKKLYEQINPDIKKICGFDYNDLEKLYIYISNVYAKRLKGLMKTTERYSDRRIRENYFFEYLKRDLFNIDKKELYEVFDKKTITSIFKEYSTQIDYHDQYNKLSDFNKYTQYPILNYNDHIIIPDIRYGICNLPKLFNYTVLSVGNNKNLGVVDECKIIKNKYSHIRGDAIEEYVVECFKKALGENAQIYKSLRYGKNKDDEADVTIVYDKYIILCECKGKLLTLSALQGEYEKIVDDFNKGIQNAYNQCCRTEKNIKQGKEFYYNTESVILKKDYRVIKLCITAENFGFLASCSMLLLKKEDYDKYPIIYSVYDIGFVTEQLKGKSLISYLIKRQEIAGKSFFIEESQNICRTLYKDKKELDKSYLNRFEEYIKKY